MRFTKKTVIVTGGGSGFGAGIATRFAAEGANILIADINVENGEAMAGQLRKGGAKTTFVRVDVSKAGDFDSLLAASMQAFGKVDILINNAGTTHRRKPLCDVTEAEFDRVFAVNVKSLYLAAKAIVPHFREHKAGVIVNIASVAAIRPPTGLCWYNATKAAVLNITKTMAVELGPDNIRVNCINPAAGETGLLEDFFAEPVTAEFLARYKSAVPLGRLTTPDDVAGACLYLASDDANFITGTAIEVDGGRAV